MGRGGGGEGRERGREGGGRIQTVCIAQKTAVRRNGL